MRNIRAEKFEKALKEWDSYKEYVQSLLNAHQITESEKNEMLKKKAIELDI